MRLTGFIILVVTLFSTLFNIYGAEASNGVLALASMILLVTLFSDLKEFNFWGLKGTKNEKDLKALEGKPGISTSSAEADPEKVQQAEQQDTIQLMDTSKGNFLAIAFEIERLLRIAATVVLGKDIPQNSNPTKLTKILAEKGLLTESGIKQTESIRWLRNMLVHGRDSEISESTLLAGIQLGWTFYNELNDWLKNPK